MTCYFPIKGYRSKEVSKNGKRKVVFNPRDGFIDQEITVPCGQCIGCRLDRARDWSIRCIHEASLYEKNCFITLTYNDENLPESGSLNLEDIQKFFKKLRKKYGEGIRYFQCGEYGEQYSRPHHHCCIFNFDFPDKKIFSTKGGHRLYISNSLSELWEFGFHTIGDLTVESAQYTARYIVKKIFGKDADKVYQGKKPEYVTMSRRPGIGKNWLDKYAEHVYKDDYVVIKGKKMKPPRYYDKRYEIDHEMEMKLVKKRRMERASDLPDNSPKRLQTRERVRRKKINSLKRSYHEN